MGTISTHDRDEVAEKLNKGLGILERKEPYDAQVYSGPSEAAEKEFSEVLQLDPNCYDAFIGLGKCYSYDPRRYIEAIDAFSRALEIRPDEAEPYYQLAVVWFHSGERRMPISDANPYDEALRCFWKARDLGYTQQSRLYNYVGTIHFRLENYEEAIIWFEKSAEFLKKEGGWIPSTFNLAAQAGESLGDFARAIRWYERLLEHGFRAKENDIKQKIKNLNALLRNTKKVL